MKKEIYTNEKLFTTIINILKEKELLPDILDYYLADHHSTHILTCEWDTVCNLNFGGNEGIYLDVYAEGNIGNNVEKIRLGTFKTLYENREAFYIMAKLEADFIIETRDFVNNHLDDFTWTGYDVKTFKDNKQTGHWSVYNKDRAYNLLKRHYKYGYDYAIIIDNETGKETKVNREEIVLD